MSYRTSGCLLYVNKVVNKHLWSFCTHCTTHILPRARAPPSAHLKGPSLPLLPGKGKGRVKKVINSTFTLEWDVSRTRMSNGTCQIDCFVGDRQQQQQREIVYIALTLFVSLLSALIASCLGMRRRRSAVTTPTRVEIRLTLRHPFTALVAGPTGCGKTRFVFKLIEHARVMVDPSPLRVSTATENISSSLASIRGWRSIRACPTWTTLTAESQRCWWSKISWTKPTAPSPTCSRRGRTIATTATSFSLRTCFTETSTFEPSVLTPTTWSFSRTREFASLAR